MAPKQLSVPGQEQTEEVGEHASERRFSLRRETLAESVLTRKEADSVPLPFEDPMRDPEWLRGYFDAETDDISFYSLYDGVRLAGRAPFLRKEWPFQWLLGPWRIAERRMVRLRLLGAGLAFPPESAAYDALFSELAKWSDDVDALYFEEIPVDSFFWKYLHESDLVRRSFVLYQPKPAAPRPLLRVEGTFQQYMAKFNSKHRNTLSRKIKKLRDGALGEMRLIRFEEPGEAPNFLEKAIAISRNTYQWTRYGRGLSAVEKVTRRLIFAAAHGWMRSYLLECGGEVRAFLLGYQYRGRFVLDEIGFDPELAKYSVGTVLQMLVVEDLFTYNRPQVFDLQAYGAYKEVLATESYTEATLFLLRRTAYARFLKLSHRGCTLIDRSASSLLNRLNLKAKIRQRVRGWSARQAI